MNLQQLEYIIALDSCRHFARAAEQCFVTQATLSMMIKKLEEELDIKIFDRSKQPVVPTEAGQKVIRQARVILHETARIKEIVEEEQRMLAGHLRLGIIPTLAPYLLPLFLKKFLDKYPQVNLYVSELTTDDILAKMEMNQLDVGLLSLPIHNASLKEHPLFFEEFVLYASTGEEILNKDYVLANDIDPGRLCLLEEGHCLRNQVIHLCALKDDHKNMRQFNFETGSIETLKRVVEHQGGITILPSLALDFMPVEKKKNVRWFRNHIPVRRIGLVTYRYFLKERLIEKLQEEILASIPEEMRHKGQREVINM